MIERLSEIRCKEVINVADGCRLGYAEDFEIDLQDGRLIALLIPGPCRFLGLFGRDSDYVVPWHSVKKIGCDIILVDVVPDKIKRPRVKKGFFK